MQTPQSQFKLFGTYSAIQSGRGTQITLPTSYCKANGVKPGTPIDLYVVEGQPGYLLIIPHKEAKP